MNNEEKLKEAKRLYQTATPDQRYVLESLFPKLAESEDEKIRKALIRFHKSTINIDGVSGEKIVAWLEKQGEQTINQPDFEIPFGAKDSELIEESYYIPKGYHAEISKDKVTIKKGEQKPSWSEDDEKNLQGIIDEIQANKSSAPSYDINVYDRYLSWLKSLKQRIGG